MASNVMANPMGWMGLMEIHRVLGSLHASKGNENDNGGEDERREGVGCGNVDHDREAKPSFGVRYPRRDDQ